MGCSSSKSSHEVAGLNSFQNKDISKNSKNGSKQIDTSDFIDIQRDNSSSIIIGKAIRNSLKLLGPKKTNDNEKNSKNNSSKQTDASEFIDIQRDNSTALIIGKAIRNSLTMLSPKKTNDNEKNSKNNSSKQTDASEFIDIQRDNSTALIIGRAIRNSLTTNKHNNKSLTKKEEFQKKQLRMSLVRSKSLLDLDDQEIKLTAPEYVDVQRDNSNSFITATKVRDMYKYKDDSVEPLQANGNGNEKTVCQDFCLLGPCAFFYELIYSDNSLGALDKIREKRLDSLFNIYYSKEGILNLQK